VLCWVRQVFEFRRCEHGKLVPHTLSGEIDGLDFEGAPIDWIARGVDENVVNSPDEVAGIFVPFIVLPRGWLSAQAVQKTDLAKHNWLGGLQQSLAHPTEDTACL